MTDKSLLVRRAREVGCQTPSAAYFSGAVRMESLARPATFDCEVLRVNFFPGGRTGWHTHPIGQVLVVTSGTGVVATRELSHLITMGDVVEIPAGVEHWHGAAPETPMQHIAIQPGGATAWLELVTDADYAAISTAALEADSA